MAARSRLGSSGSISTPDISALNGVSGSSSGSTGWPSTLQPSMPGSGGMRRISGMPGVTSSRLPRSR